MKRLHWLAAAAVLGFGSAAAQETPTVAHPNTAASELQPGTTAGDLRDIGDMRVLGVNGEEIGEIEDVLVDPDGRVTAVSVEAGGFLGMGERDVVMQLDSLELQGDAFTTTMTQEEIEALPAWDDND
jgi:hypothetical protein